jgi:tetratricopeptide (TPR) repeat protein
LEKKEPENAMELLEQGLYYYGLGKVNVAIDLWKKVLQLEPENELAREYLSIELGVDLLTSRDTPIDALSQEPEKPEELEELEELEEPGEPEQEKAPAVSQFFTQGQQHLYAGKMIDAALSFARAYDETNGRLLYWAHAELSKTSMVKRLREEIGSFKKVPELTKPMSELAKMNFTEEDGFMLSLITGDTSFEDVISLSPLTKYKTYQTLYRFLENGIVRIKDGY